MAQRLPISAVVPVLNEERNIADCLRSLRSIDEVIVVDSQSTDQTTTIASGMNAQVVQFDYQPGGPRKKNWSLENLPFRNDWVLLIDADERLTPDLVCELESLFSSGPAYDGYYLNRRHIFLGRWLRYGGNFPSWNLRLLKRNAGRYERLGTEELESAGDVEVHEHIVLDGKAGYVQAPMLHEDFKDLHCFIDRHNRYSTWDAKMRSRLLAENAATSSIDAKPFGDPVERKRYLKKIWVHLPCKPLLRFLYMYLVRLGILDGRAGFYYSVFKAIQEFHISCKMRELSATS